MSTDILYFCFFIFILLISVFLIRHNLIDWAVHTFSKEQLIWWGIRKWEYYEDEFGSGDEKTVIHLRICQYTDVTQIYDYEKKKFVNYG